MAEQTCSLYSCCVLVFTYLRAIETFVQSSGIDLAWMKSKWFRGNTVKQVFTCSVMLQALDCLKDIYLCTLSLSEVC